MMRKLKKYYPLITAPLLTMVILLYVFYLYGMYPFGNGSIAWCDMNQQGIPLLMDFKDILNGRDSIFLNMNNAGGMNFWGVFCFFLSNPLSFLAAFVPKEEIIYFVNILVILKLILCAFTAALYFIVCKEKLGKGFSVSLSLMYALCGYGMLFYQNIMWLDIMYLFPILMIGLERLTKQRKNIIYIISLSAITVMNFYICYMVAVFILLYMAIYILANRKQKDCRKVCTKFLLGTIVSALITAVVWLPSLFQVAASGRLKSVYDTIQGSNFLSSYYTVLPLLFCTAFIFVVIVSEFFSLKIRTPEQRNHLILFALTLIPFFIEPVNILWHTGNYMSFPARYGFITIFIGLICCADFLIEQSENISVQKKSIQLIFLSVTLLVLIGYYLFSKNYIDENFKTLTEYTSTLWGDKKSFDGLAELFVITAICYLVLYLLYRKKLIIKQVFVIMLAAMCALEAMGNIRIYMVSPAINNPVRTETFVDVTKLCDTINNDDFYRVIADDKKSDYNMTGALGYHSLSHYTSLTDHDFMVMQRLLGYSTVWMKSGSSGGTELTDALYCVKYKITSDKKIEELPYYSGLGIICDNNFSGCADIPSDLTRAQIQQYIFSEIYHTDDQLIKEYDYNSSSSGIQYFKQKYHINSGAVIKYSFYVSGKQSLYADCFDGFSNHLSEEYFESLNIKVNGMTIENEYPKADKNGLLRLGEFENENITVQITVNKTISCYSFGVFGLDLNILSETIDKTECAGLNYNNGKITGTINSEKNKTCFLSVPYNQGLIVKINGETVPCKKVLSDFTAFDLKEGENNIEISLIPKGFICGLIITIIGIALLVLYTFFHTKIYIPKKFGELLEIITGIIAVCSMMIVYGVSMIMNLS